MTFTDQNKVWEVVSRMVEADQPRARNRTRINQLFNGNPPYTDQEAAENRIDTNVNFLEGTKIVHDARRQYTNAFMRPRRLFTVHVDAGPVWKRADWSAVITKNLNRVLKRNQRFRQNLKNQFASVVLHGIGSLTWMKRGDWQPKSVGIEDIHVPSRTLVSLENLEYFAIRTSYTAGQLIEMTRQKPVDKGWNEEIVKAVLKELVETDNSLGNQGDQSYYADYPEKIEEDYKENSGFWSSDLVPTVTCYDFYFKNDSGKWNRRILVDRQSHSDESYAGDFIFDPGDRDYGREHEQIIHWHFADGAVVPPFKYHSVRSLGFLLYSVCHLQNRLRCKFTDAVFESMLWYFRNVTEGDRERLERVDLHHLGIIPEGLSWVPAGERQTINYQVLEGALSMQRQLMSEHSASFTQDIDSGTKKEQTATEVMARVNAASSLLGGMLEDGYGYQESLCRELARRFAVLDHRDCKQFREDCVNEGVPKSVFEIFDHWEVEPERVIGNGNKTLELAQVDRLMAVRPLLDPESQREVTHRYVVANTDDPALAERLVKIGDSTPSDAVEKATLAWGTLIDGKPVIITSGISRIDYVETLLQLLDSDIKRINASGGTPDLHRITGLANVIQHIGNVVQLIAQDDSQKDRAKIYMDALGQASNYVKAYAQRLQEAAAQQGQQMDPETQAKIQSQLILAKSKANIAEMTADMKRQQKEIAFQQEQQRKDQQAAADIRRGDAMTATEIAKENLKAKADLNRHESEPET